MKILIVDDDPDVLDVLEFQLERLGHRVSTAPTVELALELAPDAQFVITDLHIGGETCSPIVRACGEAGIDAAVISASPDEVHAIGLDEGTTRVLAKPISIAELRDVVGEAA